MITQDELKKQLHYDSETGVFTWLISNSPRVKIGDIAGFFDKYKYGYIFIRINKKLYRAHRLAFLYMEGKFPPKDVDHIDRVRHNNIWNNLRKATRLENMQNISLSSRNTSGYLGVSFDKKRNKFISQIKINGNIKYIGRFETAIQAHIKYVETKKLLRDFA